MKFIKDKIILSPGDIDLSFSPLSKYINEETYVLGAFNPGFEKLQNGNLVIMVRVAESLKKLIKDGFFRVIRLTQQGEYIIDNYPESEVDTSDPRKYKMTNYQHAKIYGLTSFSWLLPVELTPDGLDIIKIHYDKIIKPEETFQEYGIEDARITKIENKYWMTTCSVSSERHSTTLYSSNNGLDYKLEGIILDHQNKDMVLFPETINDKYFAFTRPLGDLYFSTAIDSVYSPGPSINLAQSPDLLHWKPCDKPFIRAKRDSQISMKLGSGAPPIKTEKGWLVLFHGVEKNGEVGIYRTFKAYLDSEQPWKIKSIDYDNPVMEANPKLTQQLSDRIYVEDVVFTTGIIDAGHHFIIASGELDLCCRITHLNKTDI
ncbi:MAG: glycosidase [Fidelibacterota bacterium]